jgi:hypothetical protein
MNTHMNRWIAPLGWTVAMLILWALFVPTRLSVTTFVLLGVTGLVVSFFGSTFFRESQPPRSVNAILDELEAEPKAAGPSGRQA